MNLNEYATLTIMNTWDQDEKKWMWKLERRWRMILKVKTYLWNQCVNEFLYVRLDNTDNNQLVNDNRIGYN